MECEDRFMEFVFVVEWFLPFGRDPSGSFEVLLPACFPENQDWKPIRVEAQSSVESVTAVACIDAYFFDFACRNRFAFQLRYSDEETECVVELDGSVLLMKEHLENSGVFAFAGFEAVNFSVFIDADLLNECLVSAFAPTFLHMVNFTNLPETNDAMVLKWSVDENEYEVPVLEEKINIAIPVLYRQNKKVNISLKSQKGDVIGTCAISLLPAKKGLQPLKGGLSLNYEILDYAAGLEAIPEDPGPVPRPPVLKMKAVDRRQAVLNDLGENQTEKILALEKRNVTFNRWIITCAREDSTWPVASEVIDVIKKHQDAVCLRRRIAPKDRVYRKVVRSVPDIITGFHFVTPKEQIIIVETRADPPVLASTTIERFLMSLDPHTHAIGDRSQKFPGPRLYCLFDELVKKVTVPVPMCDLLRIDGLYYKNSSTYKYYGILNKLNCLLNCTSLSEVVHSDIFPTYQELMLLHSRADTFYSLPLQIGIASVPVVQDKRLHRMNLGTQEQFPKKRPDIPPLPPKLVRSPDPVHQVTEPKGASDRKTRYSLKIYRNTGDADELKPGMPSERLLGIASPRRMSYARGDETSGSLSPRDRRFARAMSQREPGPERMLANSARPKPFIPTLDTKTTAKVSVRQRANSSRVPRVDLWKT